MRRIIFLAWVAIGGCSGTTTTNDDAGADATVDEGGSDASNDVASNDVATNDAPADVVAATCDAGCRACCRELHPDAGAIIRKDEQTCACTKPGDCEAGAVCGDNLCSDKKETVACIACLDDGDAGDCTQKALAKCAVQPECAALEACIAACGADGG